MKRKVLSAMIICTLSASLIAGCGGDKETPEQKAVAQIQAETKLDANQSQNIYNTLKSVGVANFTFKAAPEMDNLNKAGEKAYSIKYDKAKKEVIVLTAPDGSVWRILYSGHFLYADGAVKNNIDKYIK